MSEEVHKWLVDIREAVDNIEVHLGCRRDFAVYQTNITIRRAVERELEITGEAMSRILKTDNIVSIINARRIVDLRNRVIHAYDAVDDVLVWSVIIKNLPALKTEIDQLIK